MKQIITSSAILGGALIVSSLFISGSLSLKNTHVLNVVDGAVKLGEVYGEDDLVSARIEFDNAPDQVLFENSGPSEAIENLNTKMKRFAEQINTNQKDESKKATAESISLKVPGKLVFTSAVRYRAQYQPSFTLTLEEKETNIAINANMMGTIQPQLEDFLKNQKKNYDGSHFLD